VLDLRQAARLLGGKVSDGQVLCPGPTHSAGDQSLAVRPSKTALDGFVVHSHAGDDPLACKDYVREKLGLAPFAANGAHAPRPRAKGPREAKPQGDGSEIVMPVPADAPPAPTVLTGRGKPAGRWTYRDEAGATLFFVLRYNKPGGKDFFPLTLWRTPSGKLEWRWKGVPAVRPLYGLDQIAARPDAPVIVAEGEKSADAAGRLLPDYVAVASLNGAQSPRQSDWSALRGRRVTIWPDADEPGAAYARAVADLALAAGAESVAIVALPEGLDEGADAADAEAEGCEPGDFDELIAGATPYEAKADEGPREDEVPQASAEASPSEAREAPRPLRRPLSPGEAFPIDALGNVLGDAARAILDKVQCPDAIAANSVLGAASMAAQALADVVLPATGRARPLSLFLTTVAASGERKSAADADALWPIRKREDNLGEAYSADVVDYLRAKRAYDAAAARAEKTKGSRADIEAALRDVGDEPPPPLKPILTSDSPTIEGLHKLFQDGQPSLGLFSDEGGVFIGGHAMSEENRLRTVAGLSSLWDGAPIRRVRAVDGTVLMPGRRLAVHIMAQPDAAARMLSDPVLMDQGFLSRMLVAAPASTAGTRLQRKLRPETEPALRRYGARLLDILETPPMLMPGTRNALDPRRIAFEARAIARWTEFADYVEKMLGPGAPLEPVRGFANKLPEHVARIAGVLTLIDDPRANSIGLDALERAITIADFYTTEALRLFEAGSCSPELRQAEKLLEWLRTSWREPLIGLKIIYQFGPNSIRDKASAVKAVAILEDHGWLRRVSEPHPVVAEKPVREAWRIVREG
jgi:hypothetical protein